MPPRPLPPRPVPAGGVTGEPQCGGPDVRNSPFTLPAELKGSSQALGYDYDQRHSYSDYVPSTHSVDVNLYHAPSLAPPLSSLSLHDVGSEAMHWPYGGAAAAGSASAVSSTQTAIQSSVAHQQAAPTSQQPSDIEQITYQYALRYAMLLDADNVLLAARTRSLGGFDALLNAPEGQHGFAVNTVGRASGAPNLNNRTPTLVVSNRADAAAAGATERGSNSSKSKGWKSSLLELSDSAARRLKAEIGGTGKLKQLAKGKSSSGFAQKLPAKDGGMTSNILKALMQQLKTSAGSSSLHPITRDCYLEMHGYLR
ncbi:hypothetical protein IWW38_003343, partial [Coemansia aciculifera]